MKKYNMAAILVLLSGFILSGCVVRTYKVTKERVDQNLTVGNRGCLAGECSQGDIEKQKTRTVQHIEVELRSPVKFERMPKVKAGETPEAGIEASKADQESWGNRGYITEGLSSEESDASGSAAMEKYTVKKGDTLQKISQQFYGTTKKYIKIYEANQDSLKGPNKIYPGQVLNIPVEAPRELKEPKVNLK